jgi:hypothetical protein
LAVEMLLDVVHFADICVISSALTSFFVRVFGITLFAFEFDHGTFFFVFDSLLEGPSFFARHLLHSGEDAGEEISLDCFFAKVDVVSY